MVVERVLKKNLYLLLVFLSQHGIWPGEAVLMMLDDVELRWKRGHLSHLQSAVELLIGVVLGEHMDKV